MTILDGMQVRPHPALAWMRAVAKVGRLLWRALLMIVALTGLSVGIARARLPASECAVSQAQIDALVIEKMSYADVKGVLGCDGILKQRQAYSADLVIEDYAWRGNAWPYARFQGHFINGQLHGTETYQIVLAIR
ncbi:MAG: hypothetical protein ABL907_13985 [Hyphomicrobium sp.]